MSPVDEQLQELLRTAAGEPPQTVTIEAVEDRYRRRRRLQQISGAGLAVVVLAGLGAGLGATLTGGSSSLHEITPAGSPSAAPSGVRPTPSAGPAGPRPPAGTLAVPSITAKADAVQACQVFRSTSAGGSNTASATEVQRAFARAATDAQAATRLDHRWQQLANDLTQFAGLPETGVTPQQQAEAVQDTQRINATCAALVPSLYASPSPAGAAQPTPTQVGPGTASLTYSGVLSGPLLHAVAYCYPRSGAMSEITVNGSLNGTPWVLFVQSYDAQTGVWQVLSGQTGGGTGMVGEGYADTASYPATVSGVGPVDWAHGATLDVHLTSRSGQEPPGDIEVRGSITCG